MTVQQLLSWVAYAHDRHDCSFDDTANKHTICLKQALLESEPKMDTHGYAASDGERELAIVLVHTCNYQEVCDMENDAYNISKEPLNIQTNVHRPIQNHYITAAEAIRQSEEARQAFTLTPTLTEDRPIGEILYSQGQIAEERPPLPASYVSDVMESVRQAVTESPGVSTHE